MKNVVLTEQQIVNIMNKIVNEQVPAVQATEYTLNDGKYHQKVRVDFNHYWSKIRPTYKGGEIDDITEIEMDVSFMIDIQHEPNGIKGIYIHNINGPKEIKTTIKYFPVDGKKDEWGDTEEVEEPITFLLNWKRIEKDQYSKIEHIGIEDVLTIRLEPDGRDGLMVKSMEISVNELNS